MNLVKHNPDKMSCKNIAGMIISLTEEFQCEYDKLKAEITRLTAEREAAVRDIHIVANNQKVMPCEVCLARDKNISDCLGCSALSSKFEWRGIQPETGGRTHDGRAQNE